MTESIAVGAPQAAGKILDHWLASEFEVGQRRRSRR